MPDWLHNARFYAIVWGIAAVLFAAVLLITIGPGLAWGIIAAAVLAGAVLWLGGLVGHVHAEFVLPWWIGIAAGLVLGVAILIGRLFGWLA